MFSDEVLALNPELKPATTYRTKAERALKLSAADGYYDSQLERAFDQELTARAWPHLLHPFTMHLPGGVDYTPDFIAWPGGGQSPIIYEVKGHNQMKNARDSRTRFKIAAGLHRYARFVWVTRESGQWIEKPYSGS